MGIACLGLFGLASYTAEQRTRDIGIRKVLGVSVFDIVRLLVRDFTMLVFIAICLAAPAAYLAMNSWLQNYVYRITLDMELFLVSGGLILVIAWLTVSYNAIKAATADPVEALRYE